MDAVIKKLNYKNHKQVFVLNAPEAFDLPIQSLAGISEIRTEIKETDKIEFVIAFATKQQEINEITLLAAPKLSGDAIFWICYPKGTSKKYKCDFNRDSGWNILGSFDLEGVRQVAIDEDWSALRFRKNEFIKTLSRNEKMALSATGRQRTKKQ